MIFVCFFNIKKQQSYDSFIIQIYITTKLGEIIMILLARLCKIWINVSLLNILNIVTMFVPYTVATCRERKGGKEEGISTAKQITAQINWTLKLILFRNSRYQKLQHSNLLLSRNWTHNNCFEQKIFKKKWKNVSIGHRCFHFQLKKLVA